MSFSLGQFVVNTARFHLKGNLAVLMGIVIATARAQIGDRVLGYESGADLYLTKPVHPRELIAGIAALGNRLHPKVNTSDQRLQVNPSKLELSGPLGSTDLTAGELLILSALALAAAVAAPASAQTMLKFSHTDQQAKGEADLHRLVAAAEAVAAGQHMDRVAGRGQAEGLEAFGEVGDGVDPALHLPVAAGLQQGVVDGDGQGAEGAARSDAALAIRVRGRPVRVRDPPLPDGPRRRLRRRESVEHAETER